MKNLVDAADIKALTAVQLNVDAQRLEVTIPQAQERHLRPLLGQKLYAALLAFVQEETPDANNPLAKLAKEVKAMLSQWALIEAWPNLLAHVANAGILIKTGNAQGTTSADVATLNLVFSSYRETAVWRGQELSRWLESNKADYPAYDSIRPPAAAATGRQPLGGVNV